MNKILEKLSLLLLGLFVLLSLLFTYLIWFSPNDKNQLEDSVNHSLQETQNEINERNVFLPTYLVFRDDSKKYWVQGENVISNAQEILSNSNFGSAKLVKNRNDYEEKMKIDNGVELRYETKFLFSEYQSIFDMKIKAEDRSVKDFWFNRLVIDFSIGIIYFVNDHEEDFVEAAGTFNQRSFDALKDGNGEKLVPVSEGHRFLGYKYAIEEPTTLKEFNYLCSSQPYTAFRDAFFINPEEVFNNGESADIQYASDANEKLNIDAKNGIVHFDGFVEKSKIINELQDSFEYMRKLSSIFPNTRYFSTEGDQVVYRNFVEGYPIFSHLEKGKVQFDFGNTDAVGRAVKIQTNIDSLQVPVPSEKTVTLPPCMEIVAQLEKYGAKSIDVSSVIIGYGWNTNEDEKNVVSLTPSWFVDYKNEWYSISDLLNHLKGGQ